MVIASVGRCSQPSGPAGTPASRFGVRQLDSVRQLREITCPVRPIKGRARARPRVQWSYLPQTPAPRLNRVHEYSMTLTGTRLHAVCDKYVMSVRAGRISPTQVIPAVVFGGPGFAGVTWVGESRAGLTA